MNRVLIIEGESGSGKDTILKALCKMSNFSVVTSVTSRKPRIGEREGVDYHFVSNEQFETSIRIGVFAEWTKYEGDRYYGSLKSDYCNRPFDVIAVLNPHGIRQLRKNLPDLDIFEVYVTAPLRIRAERYISRCSDKFNTSDMTELANRTQRDSTMFMGIEQEADLIVHNTGSIEDTARYILEKFNEKKERR